MIPLLKVASASSGPLMPHAVGLQKKWVPALRPATICYYMEGLVRLVYKYYKISYKWMSVGIPMK